MFPARAASPLAAPLPLRLPLRLPPSPLCISPSRLPSASLSLASNLTVEVGKLHVIVRKSTSTRSIVSSSYNKSHALNSLTSMTPRASNLTGVEIYSLQSSREPTPRSSSSNQTDFYAMFASKMPSPKHGYSGNYQNDVFSLQSSKGVTPSTSNFEEEMMTMKGGGGGGGKNKGGRSMSNEFLNGGPYPGPNPTLAAAGLGSGGKKKEGGSKELHMFVWSSSASPVSEGNLKHMVNRAGVGDRQISARKCKCLTWGDGLGPRDRSLGQGDGFCYYFVFNFLF